MRYCSHNSPFLYLWKNSNLNLDYYYVGLNNVVLHRLGRSAQFNRIQNLE